ncbi:hypothetical protein [Spirosoma areae]
MLGRTWALRSQTPVLRQQAGRDLDHNLQTEPSYYETLLYIYPHQGLVREHLLDALNMLILDALEQSASIASVINAVCDQVLAYQSQMNNEELANTVMSRIRHFLYHGVLAVVA